MITACLINNFTFHICLHAGIQISGKVNYAAQGKVLERVEATRGKGNWWKFTPPVDGGSILAEAWDLPKNVTRMVLE